MSDQTPEQGMSFLKGCLMAIAVLVVVVIYIVAGTLLFHLENPWVGLLALTAWGALFGNNIADAPKVFIGSTVALLVGASQWYLPTILGPVAGAIIPLLIIICLLGGMVAGKLPIICNFATFIMLTVVTLVPSIVQGQLHVLLLKDMAFGIVIFWALPYLITKIAAAKKGSAA